MITVIFQFKIFKPATEKRGISPPIWIRWTGKGSKSGAIRMGGIIHARTIANAKNKINNQVASVVQWLGIMDDDIRVKKEVEVSEELQTKKKNVRILFRRKGVMND